MLGLHPTLSRKRPRSMTASLLLRLLLCVALALQGVVAAVAAERSCPMSGMAMSHDASHPCCNDEAPSGSEAPCKSGQECPVPPALTFPAGVAVLPQASLSLLPAARAGLLPFDPSAVWRPPIRS